MDIALVAAVAALGLKGAFRGFFREAFGLLALACGAAASVFLGRTLGVRLAHLWSLDPGLARAAAHAVLFLGPYLLFQASGYVLHRLGRALYLGGVDRLAGFALGGLAGILLSGGVLGLLGQWPWGTRWLEGSRLAGPFAAMTARAVRWASALWS